MFLLFFIFLICEWMVNPLGEFPLNDDWSYSKSILNWMKDGVFSIGDWPAMTLYTHLLWGMLFTKVAGFSFFVLRFSTIIMSMIGIWVLFHLVHGITKEVGISFLAALVMMVNPIYFNLSNTYMTDITFNTLLLVCCYFAHSFFRKNNVVSFSLVFVFSILLVLTRQLGVILPISFLFACLGLRKGRTFYLVLGILFTALNFLVLRTYENYLHHLLPVSSAYKFSGEINPFDRGFWDTLLVNLRWRHSTILLHFLAFTLPFSVVYLFSVGRGASLNVKLLVTALVLGFTLLVFYKEPFPQGNVFVNIGVGTRTFYEYLCSTTSNVIEHASSQVFEDRMHWVKLALVFINSFIIVLGIIKWRQLKLRLFEGDPSKLFFLLFMMSYSVMILIPGSYFDRYHLPLITVGIILLSYLSKITSFKLRATLPLVLIMMYVSVAGTKDYFTINKIRWQAYYYLKNDRKIDPEKINGGFEVNCWNEGKYAFWYLFLELDRYDYLIQFSPEPKFKPLKEYEFQRYFPYKKDKIFIFARRPDPS